MSTRRGGPELRGHPRAPVSLKITGRWWLAGGEPQPLVALLVSLSEGGATLRTAQAVPANATVEFVLKPEPTRSVLARGQVRWWRKRGEVRDLGVEFSPALRELGPIVRSALERAPG